MHGMESKWWESNGKCAAIPVEDLNQKFPCQNQHVSEHDWCVIRPEKTNSRILLVPRWWKAVGLARFLDLIAHFQPCSIDSFSVITSLVPLFDSVSALLWGNFQLGDGIAVHPRTSLTFDWKHGGMKLRKWQHNVVTFQNLSALVTIIPTASKQLCNSFFLRQQHLTTCRQQHLRSWLPRRSSWDRYFVLLWK